MNEHIESPSDSCEWEVIWGVPHHKDDPISYATVVLAVHWNTYKAVLELMDMPLEPSAMLFLPPCEIENATDDLPGSTDSPTDSPKGL